MRHGTKSTVAAMNSRQGRSIRQGVEVVVDRWDSDGRSGPHGPAPDMLTGPSGPGLPKEGFPTMNRAPLPRGPDCGKLDGPTTSFCHDTLDVASCSPIGAEFVTN